MRKFFRNPVSIWLYRLLKNFFLELKNRRFNIKISSNASVIACSFGQRNTIYTGVNLNEVTLGDFTYVADGASITKTSIGKFCSIGPNTKIGLGRHPSSTYVSTHPIFFSPLRQAQITFADKSYFDEYQEIIIGNDVWIGANVMILDGVEIEDGAIIAAGAVVTKNIPPYAIVGGVPAEIIRFRFDKEDIDKLLKIKWWNMELDYLQKNHTKFHDVSEFLG